MKRVVVHIGQLGLQGLQGVEARAVVDALRGELGAALAPGRVGGDVPAGPVRPMRSLRIAAAASPAQLGSAAAAAVGAAIRAQTPTRGGRT